VATYGLDNCPVENRCARRHRHPPRRLRRPCPVRKADGDQDGAGAAAVEVTARIQNAGAWPMELSVWTPTVMAPGGIGITGFPPRGRHEDILEPTNPLVMWAYTDFLGPTLALRHQVLGLKHDPAARAPQKIGHWNAKTWGAYLAERRAFREALRCPGRPAVSRLRLLIRDLHEPRHAGTGDHGPAGPPRPRRVDRARRALVAPPRRKRSSPSPTPNWIARFCR